MIVHLIHIDWLFLDSVAKFYFSFEKFLNVRGWIYKSFITLKPTKPSTVLGSRWLEGIGIRSQTCFQDHTKKNRKFGKRQRGSNSASAMYKLMLGKFMNVKRFSFHNYKIEGAVLL